MKSYNFHVRQETYNLQNIEQQQNTTNERKHRTLFVRRLSKDNQSCVNNHDCRLTTWDPINPKCDRRYIYVKREPPQLIQTLSSLIPKVRNKQLRITSLRNQKFKAHIRYIGTQIIINFN